MSQYTNPNNFNRKSEHIRRVNGLLRTLEEQINQCGQSNELLLQQVLTEALEAKF